MFCQESSDSFWSMKHDNFMDPMTNPPPNDKKPVIRCWLGYTFYRFESI